MSDSKPELAHFRYALAEVVHRLLNLMDSIDGDADFEPEPLELADDSEESAEPIRDPVLYFLNLERALKGGR